MYHYTGNDGDTATANAAYYRDNIVQASAHYFVDDREIVQSVADEEIAWAVGGRKWKDCAQTGGGTLHGVVTNANSISIEMCGTLGDGSRRASETTLRNAAALGRRLMARYGIPIERVVRHFDVTGKYCPAYLMDAAAWSEFKRRLTPQTPTCKAPLPVLTRGCTGESVRALQALLNLRGAALEIDGSFGALTDAAVRDFQRRRGLAVDGIVGPATWAALVTGKEEI